MADLKRNVETKISALLEYFPVFIILGVRQCGKTTLAQMLTHFGITHYYISLVTFSVRLRARI